MSASLHKGIIAMWLAQEGLDASIDPLWNVTRDLCSSDEECRARVMIGLIQMQIAAVERRLEARPPQIDRDVAATLLGGYSSQLTLLQGELAAALSAITPVRINLGFTVPTRSDW
jgi:hypothetical protein